MISEKHHRDVLMFAFHHALGRSSICSIVEALEDSWDELSHDDRVYIQNEIRVAIGDCRAGGKYEQLLWDVILDLPA